MLIISLILLGIVCLGLWVLWAHKKRQVRLDPKILSRAVKAIEKMATLNPEHAVMDAHKHFTAALQTMVGDKQNAASLIGKFATRFKDPKAIWRAHNLRNRVAHETNIKVTPKQADMVRKVLIKGLKDLI